MAAKFLLKVFLFFISLFSRSQAQTSHRNLTVGSIIYANATPNFLLSPSGNFAFGFYPSGSGFKFGIWLVGIPNNTIVWTTRRTEPVLSSGAALLFTVDRRLLLRRENGDMGLVAASSWKAVTGSILDSGKFVLYDSNSEIVWTSFKYPTDTLLVGQQLVQNDYLGSSLSLTNRTVGRYKLWLQEDGNLNAVEASGNGQEVVYWSSYTSGAWRNVSLSLDQDGRLYLGNPSGFVVKNFTEGGFAVSGGVLYRATFDVDGILRLYQHRIGANGSLNEKILWTMIDDRCLMGGSYELNSNCSVNNGRHDHKMIKKVDKEFLVVGIVLIAFSFIAFMLTGLLVYTKNICSYKINSRQASPSSGIEEISLRSFGYNELAVATNNFKEEIGRGASGRVYKGYLAANGGKEIAVKMLVHMVEEGESEFRNEMRIIGRTRHKNLVNLIGFCTEGSNRLLVYEFMKNGSLENVLFKAKKRPSWSERRRIALEIAKGLHYLHEECETRIIHCDIKPHNILMDESWTAKISDFGLSKLLKGDQTRTYTVARGTRGYAAPEWHYNNAPITVKADVYSFGVMLLEIICCRKNVDESLKDEEIILVDWVYQCYDAGELRKLVDEEDIDMEEVETMVKIGLWCLEYEYALRPTMKQVILMMEGIVVIPPPRPPTPYPSVKGESVL